jgi:hypothetical protein
MFKQIFRDNNNIFVYLNKFKNKNNCKLDIKCDIEGILNLGT